MEEKNAVKNRVGYLDTIKAISIFLVVFCHFPALNLNSCVDNIAMIVCWAAVPCFFMTTGAIYLNKKWNFSKYIYRIISIYVTICIWKALYLLFYQCIGKMDIFKLPAKLVFNYIFLFDGLNGVTTGHLWFMHSYLQIFLIYPFLNLCFQNFKDYKNFIIVILILLVCVGFLPNTIDLILETINVKGIAINNLSKINPFGTNTTMLFFFIIGGILYKFNIYEKFEKKKIAIRLVSIIAFIIGIIGLMIIKKCQFGTYQWKYIYVGNGYNWLSTIIMSLGFFVFMQGINIKCNPVNKVFTMIGQNTMGIFYLHVLILEFRSKMNFGIQGTIFNSLRALIIVVICCIASIIIRKIPVVKRLLE